jgi:hypothetical protein
MFLNEFDPELDLGFLRGEPFCCFLQKDLVKQN